MPLLTSILVPERFTSAVIAGYTLDSLRDRTPAVLLSGRAAGEQRVMTDAIQFALDRMKAEGVFS